MQLSIGLTTVDLLHENGSLLASRDDLCACFGLTRPEYEHMMTFMPPETEPCRDGYLPLGAFLKAVSQVMHQDLSDPELHSAEQLRELELRTHNYIFLLGALGYDLLGSHQDEVGRAGAAAAGMGSADELPDTAALCRELEHVSERMATAARLMSTVSGTLQHLADADAGTAADSLRTREKLHRTASDLYDLMHVTSWEYTRWYALCSARFFMNPAAASSPASSPASRQEAADAASPSRTTPSSQEQDS